MSRDYLQETNITQETNIPNKTCWYNDYFRYALIYDIINILKAEGFETDDLEDEDNCATGFAERMADAFSQDRKYITLKRTKYSYKITRYNLKNILTWLRNNGIKIDKNKEEEC
jgi:hypothetical protein